MRPAGFEPAITAVSERRVWRIISPLRFQATLRARCWIVADLLLRRDRAAVRLVSSVAHRMAPPGVEPGTPGSRPGRMDRFPTGLFPSHARTRAGDVDGDGVAHRPEIQNQRHPGTRAQRMMAALPSGNAASR